MASKVPYCALARMLSLLFVTGRDVRAILVMTNTTVDTEVAAGTISYVGDYTTLDECDGANYSRQSLTSEAAAADDANARAEFDADDVTWTSLGASTRDVQGVLLYEHVTNDADSIPLMFIEFSTNYTPDGSNFQVQWDDEGIAQGQQG